MAYFLERARELAPKLKGNEQSEGLEAVTAEVDNFRAALAAADPATQTRLSS